MSATTLPQTSAYPTVQLNGTGELPMQADAAQAQGAQAAQVVQDPAQPAGAQFPGAQTPGAQVPASQHPAASTDGSRGFAIASFVLGIASIVSGWTFIAPITGLILGVLALRRDTSERTLALWGVWLNGAMLALSALAVTAFVFLMLFGAIAMPFIG